MKFHYFIYQKHPAPILRIQKAKNDKERLLTGYVNSDDSNSKVCFLVSNFFFLKVMYVPCYMSSDEKEIENTRGQKIK